MNLKRSIGFHNGQSVMASPAEEQRLRDFVNLKLASRGLATVDQGSEFLSLGRSLLAKFQEQSRLLAEYLCPADRAIDAFLRTYLGEHADDVFKPGDSLLPHNSLVLERHGIARMLSLPADADRCESSILSSYRVHQGVCHNPLHDRRTTQGVFHVCEGGLPIPFDKKGVPQKTFARLLHHAIHPPQDLLTLPFTSQLDEPARVFVSLLLRPVISPGVSRVASEKSMEVRFFAPAALVSNLDFVESIFGNAGDPYLPENDARLDGEHWSGHTGCVILAPHLIHLTKYQLGLPHISEATPLQLRDGQCWERENELYNNGSAFKVTLRDRRGVIVTLIADSYFGYCKKEVKTQISYACNLFGNCEEEHAGGAIAYPSFDLGQDFALSEYKPAVDHSFEEVIDRIGPAIDVQPAGFGIDRNYSDIYYLPENVRISLRKQSISWNNSQQCEQHLNLQPHVTYVLPSGYKIEMIKPSDGDRWRLVGTNAEGTFCHKPCTVSGGGKSEISKSLQDAMIAGPVYVRDLKSDLIQAWEIIGRDFGDRYRAPLHPNKPSRPLLSTDRSLGSVVRLLTPNPQYTTEYNAWLEEIPGSVRDLILMIKRFYNPDWESNWSERFTVDLINGRPGNSLIYQRTRLVTQYLRVGFAEDGTWRTFSLRNDFVPAHKIQTEDDISASIVLPSSAVENLHPNLTKPSVKFVTNCEYRLFQRPDDAITPGYDRKTELDFSRGGMFFSNYEPIDRPSIQALLADTIRFDQFTKPMQRCLRQFAESKPCVGLNSPKIGKSSGESEPAVAPRSEKMTRSPAYAVSTHQPRLVHGEPTKNPRYLQNRPDLEDPRAAYLAELGARMYRRIPLGGYLPTPVNSVLLGRRNNPADPAANIRPLAVYGPVHYQQLPELFMDFVASLTGKSPSTTGAGSEGALTKGPFNALLPIHDLNAALVSYALTGDHGFSTAAGSIGRKYEMAHDISLLIPEVWSRMFIWERDPDYLIKNGLLEKVDDLVVDGRTVLASRLGYRITEGFVATFFGRVFTAAESVFTPDMLRPELQSQEDFVDGVNNIVETQQRIANNYFQDGSIEFACPPLCALLHIMAHGHFHGQTIGDASFRSLFDRDSVIHSDWYRQRLESLVTVRRRLSERNIVALERFVQNPIYRTESLRLGMAEKLEQARQDAGQLLSRDQLVGTIGVDPSLVEP